MATPTATIGSGSLKAAARKQNVIRAEQRIQSGRAYTQATVKRLQGAGIDVAKLQRAPAVQVDAQQHAAAQQPLFQAQLHQQVAEQHHQIQLQALRHALDIIKQHRALGRQQPTAAPRGRSQAAPKASFTY